MRFELLYLESDAVGSCGSWRRDDSSGDRRDEKGAIAARVWTFTATPKAAVGHVVRSLLAGYGRSCRLLRVATNLV